MDLNNIRQIANAFKIEGKLLTFNTYGSGHINDTFVVEFVHNKHSFKLLFQKINTKIFREPEKLMGNIARILQHLKVKNNESNKNLHLIPSIDGKYFFKDKNGECWRAYNFIENTITFDCTKTPEQAFEAAFAYGEFIKNLRDLPAPPLHETIPDFHNTIKRLNFFDIAIEQDICNRAMCIKNEIKYINDNRNFIFEFFETIKSSKIPVRTVHNDTKLNNVLFDKTSGKSVCVVDLDTVMPGYILSDFGDMVRSMTRTSLEDEKNLDKVQFSKEIYDKLLEGFLLGTDKCLSKKELDLLFSGAKIITYEVALRFITDYLNGNVYFKTSYPEHNLIRAKVHIKMLQNMVKIERMEN